jgi:cystathionine beta-lyase
LVVPYDMGSLRTGWPAVLKPGRVVRFSIGLEAVADLKLDLAQALNSALA